MFDPSQADVRKFFCGVWRKYQQKEIITDLEALALDAIHEHPEYHSDLADEQQALAADYPVEAGRTNPFLHLSMHLAVAEQLAINQPIGITPAYKSLAQRLDSPHDALHHVIECLGETMWKAQRNKAAPDGDAYLECVQRKTK